MKKNLLFKLLALFVVLIASVPQAKAWFTITSDEDIYFDAVDQYTRWELSSNNLYVKIYYGGGQGSSNVYEMTQISGTKLYYCGSAKGHSNVSGIEFFAGSNSSTYSYGTGWISFDGWGNALDRLDRMCYTNSTATNWSWSGNIDNPPLSTISLAKYNTTTYGGDGSYAYPYLVAAGSAIQVQVTSTKRSSSLTAKYKFTVDATTDGDYTESTTKTAVASAADGTTYAVSAQGWGYSNSNYSRHSITSNTVYFRGIASYQLTYSFGDVVGTDGSITTDPTTSSGSYIQSGNSITLTAPEAKTGYAWKGWYTNAAGTEGKITDVSRAITVKMNADKTLYACYTENTYSTNVAVTPASSGSISSPTPAEGKINVSHHTGTSVTASANTNYIFDYWSVSGGDLAFKSPKTSGDNPTTVTATSAGGTITAHFADQWVIAGIAESGTTPAFGYYRGLPNTGGTTHSASFTLEEGDYEFKVFDRKGNKWYTDKDAPAISRNATSKSADDVDTGDNMTLDVDLAGSYTFTFNTSSKALTITYPTYDEELTSMTVTPGSDFLGGDGSTVGKTKQIYSSRVSSATLSMAVSPTSSSEGGSIVYKINSGDEHSVTSPQTINASDMSLTTSAVQYTFHAYFKKGTYKSTGDEQTVSYYIQKTSDPVVSLATKISSAAATEADLATSPTITLQASVANNLVAATSNFTYYVKVPGSADWEEVSSTGGASTTYSPSAIGTYKFKVKWNHLQDWESEEVSFLVWKTYTIYVWDPSNYAKYVHIWKGGVSKYTWGDSEEAMTSESTRWGTGWYSFEMDYPKYTKFKVHLASDASGDAAQSEEYEFTEEPLEENSNIYFRCTNESDKNWGLDDGLSEPQKPEITITATNVYATKIVVTVDIDNHYSTLSTHSITINGEAQDGKRTGSVDDVEGGTYTYTLTSLTENTEYIFEVSATNGLGETEKAASVITHFKVPIHFTVKVSSNLMKNQSGYWGENSKTSVKVKYWNDDAGFSGTEELTKIKESGGYFWYKIVFPDSPVNFYVFNANYDDGTGANRSGQWNDANSNGCAEVYDDTGEYSNHLIGSPAMCGVHYKLAYYNGNTTTWSNTIGDESDKMSLFIGKTGSPAGRWLKLYQFDADWDDGTDIFSSITLSDSAVYVVSLKSGSDFESATSASDWVFEKYEGNYYIRTNKAPGAWNNYKQSGNLMTYSEYSAGLSSHPYTHYWMKWVEGDKDADRNVKFDIANDYHNSLAGGNDGFAEDDYANGSGQLKENANVRFMYDSRTNQFSRAYLRGSTREDEYFLVLKGDHAGGHHLYSSYTDVTNTEHTTNGTTDWAFFSDNQNWVYEVDVYAKPGTEVKLTAEFKNKSNVNATQYFKGSAESTETLIGGTGSNHYPMRVLYNFKTNRLMSAWMPPVEAIEDNLKDIDVLIEREGQAGANTITFSGDHNIETKNVIGSLKFDYDDIHDAAALGWTPTTRPLLTYFVSFPFDVYVSDVFGLNSNYGDAYVIRRYAGDERASKGFFRGDGTTTFWQDMPISGKMNAYEGYCVILDDEYFSGSIGHIWDDKGAGNSVYLYFPSANGGRIVAGDTTITIPEHPCTIDRTWTDPGTGKTLSHENTDANWNLMGIPVFSNYTGDDSQEGTPGAIFTEAEEAPHFYEWNGATNQLTITAGDDYVFKPMHSYFVQYAGPVKFTGSKYQVPASVAARKAPSTTNYKIELQALNSDGQMMNRTYVEMRENACDTFELNEDTYLAPNNHPIEIYSFAGSYDVAANILSIKNHVVELGVNVHNAGTYTISMVSAFSGQAILVDTYTGTRTNLSMSDYEVNLPTGMCNDRFLLEININNAPTAIDGTEDGSLKDGKAHKFIQNGVMYILENGRIYDAQGRRLQ